MAYGKQETKRMRLTSNLWKKSKAIKGVMLMKRIRITLGITLFAAVILFLSGIPAMAAEDSGDFVVENGVLTKYLGSASKVVIPDDLGITTIGDSAFYDCYRLEEIKIPNGVTSIGKRTFSDCSKLASVSFPDTLTMIGDRAFENCGSLTKINIPGKVASIGDYVFNNCNSLNYLSIPKSVTSIGYQAFGGCSRLTSITVPDSVTAIGGSVFVGSGITAPVIVKKGEILCYVPTSMESYVIPGSVKTINGGAFVECSNLASVTIPDSVESIGDAAFEKCEDVAIYGVAGSYAEQYAKSNKIPFKSILTATPRQFNVSVNGKRVAMQAYTIDGSDYFKLRYLAMALNGTGKQFDVNWDGKNNEIIILSGEAYSETGGELSLSKDAGSKSASLTTSKVYLNNHSHEMGFTAYIIGGCNYFKLSDIADAMDFYITSGAANTIEIDTSAGYSVTGNKIYYSENTWLSDEPVTGVKSSISADIDGDGKNETAEIVVSQDAGKKWTLIYKDGNSEASVPIFKGNEYGFVTSIAAGHMISENTTDFLVSANLMSMPFGGCAYELYSFKDGAFTKIDVSEITDGTEFDVSVDENKKTAKLTSSGSEKTVGLSEMALSDYKLYGKEFCQDFFVEMKLQSVESYALPDLVTTEVIAAVLPNDLTYLHTTYRYADGSWKVQKVEFYDFDEAMSGVMEKPGF